ncbi:DnaJ domain-containing protein [Polychytrium aggregatum]|uniref:DnaJ domain-containing protein n=1 Tax=Polychytrium aggregatum TaxID=110093 RepID=UPI0022FE78CF|nr:DnaJ domain-containing protein [Polychytrium aggregatum]KAI9207711.1 DnaJ domain-containing protein [Polychytrium aggregatum]
METHYAALGVPEDASADEIKRAYQALVLQLHPDKQNAAINPSADAADRFLKIQRAWETLKDVDQRRQYDAELKDRSQKYIGPIDADVDIDEMQYDEDTRSFVFPCRCGGLYVATEANLEVRNDVAPCSTCSLRIRVLYSIE